MPFDLSTFHLPGGVQCVRLVCTGTITREDADALMGHIGPGKSLYGIPMLVLAQRMEGVAAEARSLFVNTSEQHGSASSWTAIVVSNPVVRVTLNFLMRVGRTTKMKLFSSEPEALQWLDARAHEDTAKAG